MCASLSFQVTYFQCFYLYHKTRNGFSFNLVSSRIPKDLSDLLRGEIVGKDCFSKVISIARGSYPWLKMWPNILHFVAHSLSGRVQSVIGVIRGDNFMPKVANNYIALHITMLPPEILAKIPQSYEKALASGDLFFFPSIVHRHTDSGVNVRDFVSIVPAAS
jgi:hypothetical protein